MNDESSGGSWWRTLPGVLTGVGALVTALVGAVIGLKQAGVILTEQKTTARSEVARSELPVAPPDRIVRESTSTATVPSPGAPAVPSVSPAVDQVRVSDVIYKILAVGLDPYDQDKLRLRFTIRATNEGPYGINFWSRSFRLLVDSVPRPPENDLNELVDGDAAKEGEVIFAVPRSAHSLVLKIGSHDEGALIPLQLNR